MALINSNTSSTLSKIENTPMSMRKHIIVFGNTNVGKSTLFNKLLGQDMAIVSDISGTTTDPVTKAMELIPYGPVALIDTAGLGDNTALGERRTAGTMSVINRADLILYVRDALCENDFDRSAPKKDVPVINIFTKCDLADEKRIEEIKRRFRDPVLIFGYSDTELETLRKKMMAELQKQERDDETIIGGLLPRGSRLILVCPIDSEAPKGRLILPQVQLIRDCLDHDMKPYVVTEKTLESALGDLSEVPELVVTDSQAFRQVNEIVPPEIKLTSFSMLLAHQKGNFMQMLGGAAAIDTLTENSKILMLEGCTHNTSHEDIGRVKIPRLIKKYTGTEPHFEYYSGYNRPRSFEDFDLIIECGMCMINKREVTARLAEAAERGVPVSNYGIVLAKLNGILSRAAEIFNE